MQSKSKLFSAIKVGSSLLQHRVVVAPVSRFRASKKDHIPLDIAVTYYAQRASTPGTLIITEGTTIAAQAGGYDNIPGIWSEAQIKSWKRIVDEVHKSGSFIYCQIAALGRCAAPNILSENNFPYVSSSPVPLEGNPIIPQALTISEMKEYALLFAQAAENAVLKAGFDGVEIHCHNGCLLDQFIQDVVNKRTDSYGGSIENRSRFCLEVVESVVNRIGAERTAIRLSPFSLSFGMGMKNPVPQFTHFITELADRYPKLSYLHLIEPRISGAGEEKPVKGGESLDFAREAWRKTGQPFIVAGGYNRESAFAHFDDPSKDNDCIAFGRHFIANPDLPKRIEKNIPFNPYNRSTFYLPESPEGYIDYPFATAE